MPYDNSELNIDNIESVLYNSSVLDGETLRTGSQEEFTGSESDDVSDSSDLEQNHDNLYDYSTYLEDILTNQEIIITNQETIISLDQEIVNNGHRLYYFIGGLYVAFAIIIMVKFFKTFLF